MYYTIPFYNTCLNLFNISSLFSGGIIVSSTFHEIISGAGFSFTILSSILFSMNFPVGSAALWATFLKAVFRASILVFVAVSNNYFPYFLDRFLRNEKNTYPLKYFFVLGSIK